MGLEPYVVSSPQSILKEKFQLTTIILYMFIQLNEVVVIQTGTVMWWLWITNTLTFWYINVHNWWKEKFESMVHVAFGPLNLVCMCT